MFVFAQELQRLRRVDKTGGRVEVFKLMDGGKFSAFTTSK